MRDLSYCYLGSELLRQTTCLFVQVRLRCEIYKIYFVLHSVFSSRRHIIATATASLDAKHYATLAIILKRSLELYEKRDIDFDLGIRDTHRR